MKTFSTFLKDQEAKKEKHVVLVFGRMNPPTSGHGKVVEKVHEVAEQYSADHYIVLSHKHERNKNPLTIEQKLKHVKRFFPESNITTSDKEHPGILQQVAKLKDYTHLHIVAGSDRIQEYKDLIEQYNGKDFNFKQLYFHSSGDREGFQVSATQMRTAAQNCNYKTFKECVPNHITEEEVKELYFDVRKGMGLHKEALFVVGAPGCGKDIFISQITQKYSIPEIAIEQVGKRLTTNDQILVSGSAYDFKQIKKAYTKLQECGFDCKFLYVHVSDDESKKRHCERCTFNEATRKQKWDQCWNNIKMIESLDNSMMFINNSDNLVETIDDLKLMYPYIHSFFTQNIDSNFEKFMEGYDTLTPAYGSSMASTSEPVETLKDKQLDDPAPPLSSKKKKTLKDFKKKNA